MLTFIIGVMAGLFIYDNKDFLVTADKQIKAGYEWEYVGKTYVDPDTPSLPVLDSQDDEVIYFKLTK